MTFPKETNKATTNKADPKEMEIYGLTKNSE